MYLESLIQVSPESYTTFMQLEAQQMAMVADHIMERLDADNPFLVTAIKSGVRNILEAAQTGDAEEIAVCSRNAMFTVLRLIEREAQSENEEGKGIREMMKEVQQQMDPPGAGSTGAPPAPKRAPRRKTRFTE